MFVTLEEAKGYLRVDSSDEDELILRLMETSDRLILDVTRQTPEELIKNPPFPSFQVIRKLIVGIPL